MAKTEVVWTPRVSLFLDEYEAQDLANALGELALEGKLSDDALSAWQRLSSAVIEMNSRHIDGN